MKKLTVKVENEQTFMRLLFTLKSKYLMPESFYFDNLELSLDVENSKYDLTKLNLENSVGVSLV